MLLAGCGGYGGLKAAATNHRLAELAGRVEARCGVIADRWSRADKVCTGPPAAGRQECPSAPLRASLCHRVFSQLLFTKGAPPVRLDAADEIVIGCNSGYAFAACPPV